MPQKTQRISAGVYLYQTNNGANTMTKIDKEMRRLRKHYGLPKFERECRLTHEGSRLKKAYKVPGTREHGYHAMMMMQIRRVLNSLKPYLDIETGESDERSTLHKS